MFNFRKNNINFTCEPVDTPSNLPTFLCLGNNEMNLEKFEDDFVENLDIENFENSDDSNLIDNQPVSYLPLLKDAKDLGLNPQKSVVQGQTAFINHNGRSCAYFNNRMDTYVQLDNTTEATFTVAFWFNLREGNNYTIVSRTDGGNPSLQFDVNPGNHLYVHTALPNHWHSNVTKKKFDANTWYHAAYVVEGRATKIYINGELDNELTGHGPMPSRPFWFIGRSGDSGRAANVCIRQFATWKIGVEQKVIKSFMEATKEDVVVPVKLPELKCKDYQVQFGNFCLPKWVIGEQTVFDIDSFKPTQFETLTLWLDGKDRSTLFQDNNGSTPVSNPNDNVKLWKDKSGNNNNVVNQSGNTPKYQNNGIDFDNNCRMQKDSVKTSLDITIFVVAMIKPSMAEWGTFWVHQVGNDHDNNAISVRKTATKERFNIGLHTQNDNDNVILKANANDPTIFFGDMVGGTNRNFSIMSKNGVSAKVSGQNNRTLNVENGTIYVGTDEGGNWANSIICEIIYYQSKLSDSQTNNIVKYLKKKWEI
jgi:hypothetical protein